MLKVPKKPTSSMSNSDKINKFSSPDLVNTIKGLYLNESAADLHFTFNSFSGNNERIPAHKRHLIVISNVFNAMFNGSWSEKDDVDITDASPAAFKEFLQFFYSDEIELTMENVEEVLHLGQKYLVPACLNTCSLFLMKMLTNENVCFVYGLSILADVKDLKKLCEAKISLNTAEILNTSDFRECHQQVLHHTLNIESLTCSEDVIFKACMEWVCSASKQRTLNKRTVLTHLCDSFRSIRFGLMKDQLKDCFQSLEIKVEDDLRSEIYHAIESDHAESSSFKPREWNCHEEPHTECVRKTKRINYEGTDYFHNTPYEIRKPEISTFSTNVAFLLRAIVCSGVYCGLYDDNLICYKYHTVDSVRVYDFKIFEGSHEIENLEVYVEDDYVRPAKRRRVNPETKNLFPSLLLTSSHSNVIHLKKPIVITPGRNYTISLKLDDRIFDGQLSTDSVLRDNEVNVLDGIIVTFSNDAKVAGDYGNLIYGLHFSKI